MLIEAHFSRDYTRKKFFAAPARDTYPEPSN